MTVTLTLHCERCHTSASLERASVSGEVEAAARDFTARHADCAAHPLPLTPEVAHAPETRAIVDAVAATCGVPPQAVTGTSRLMPVASARALAMHLCRELRGDSYLEIGRYFQRDHTSVIAACKKVEQLLAGHGSGDKTTERRARVLQVLGMTALDSRSATP